MAYQEQAAREGVLLELPALHAGSEMEAATDSEKTASPALSPAVGVPVEGPDLRAWLAEQLIQQQRQQEAVKEQMRRYQETMQ